MTVELLFSLILAFFSIMGLVGSLSLSVTANPNTGSPVGAGAMPLAYSFILIALTLVYILTVVKKSKNKIVWRNLLERHTLEGIVFFLLSVAMFVLIHFVGTAAALFLFSIASLYYMKRLPIVKNLLFSFGWVGALYVIFVIFLHVPFESGILF
jgi:hypothetical protein